MFIYKITNTMNNKIYIGMTTRDVETRFKEHIESALYDKTKNTHLYKSIKFYGKNKFIIETIYETQSFEDLCNKEQYYIKYFNSLNPSGYNYLMGGKSNYKLSEEHILNISKPVKATNTVTKQEYFFISLSLPNTLGYNRGSISVNIKNKTSYKGYTWEHISKDEYLDNKNKTDINKVHKLYARNLKSNEILVIYHGENLTDYGFDSAKVWSILKGEKWRKSHKGYEFSYNPFQDLPVQASDLIPK